MSTIPYIRECEGGVRVSVHVQPRARKTRMVGQHGDALKIQLASPPVDGKANAALRDFLAVTLELPRAQVSLVSGQRSRAKSLVARGIDLPTAIARIAALLILIANVAFAESAFVVPEGFEVSLFADDDLAHDIFSLTIDSHGEVVVAGKNYVKRLLDSDGDERADRVELISNKPASGAHGLLFDGDALICSGDDAIMRIRDGEIETLDTLSHREHGANGIARGPDGWIYLICGNDAGVSEKQVRTPHSPIRKPETGALVRYSPDFARSEVLAHGLRNPYDLAFDAHGHVFTYDADGERDHHLPWYEPTRIYDISIGGHHGWVLKGWRQSWSRPAYFPDNAPRMLEIGRGSPTGVATYQHRRFPARYRSGVFAICWTMGRIYFCPTEREGASYRSSKEIFLQGAGSNGFAPVDMAVAPNGDVFVAIGGRGTRGSVYRIRYGAEPPAPEDPVLDADQPLSAWSRARWLPLADARGAAAFLAVAADESASTARRMRAIEILVDRFDGVPAEAANRIAKSANDSVVARLAWADRGAAAKLVSHPSPWVRRAARENGAEAAAPAADPSPSLSSLRDLQKKIGDINAFAADPLDSGYSAHAPVPLPELRRWIAEFPTGNAPVDRELARLLAMTEAPIPAEFATIWTAESEPESDIHYLLCAARLTGPRSKTLTGAIATALLGLHAKMEHRGYHTDENWPRCVNAVFARLCERDPALATTVVTHANFGHLEHTGFVSSLPESMQRLAVDRILICGRWSAELLKLAKDRPPEFLRLAWKDVALRDSLLPILAKHRDPLDTDRLLVGLKSPRSAVANACKKALIAMNVPLPTAEPAPHTADWTERLAGVDWSDGDAGRGRAVYEARACASCHDGSRRLGPSLKGVSARFSRDDLFAQILDPNAQISPLYKAWQVVSTDGQVHVGVPVYQSPAGTILETGPGTTVRFTGDQVARYEPVTQSPMPARLLEGVSDAELADFYAYLKTLR